MKVEVKVVELLDILKKNREAHRQVFEQALDGYKKEWQELLEKRLERLKAGKIPDPMISVTKPTDQTRDYDRVIRMLELDVNETWTLEEADFACYVEDDWQWKRQFLETTSYYNTKWGQ